MIPMLVKKLDFKKDLDKAIFVQFLIIVVTLFSILFYYFTQKESSFLILALEAGVFLFFYQFYLRSLVNIVYTFWGLTFFVFLFHLINLNQALFFSNSLTLFCIHLSALLLLAIMAHIMSSPIFYPRVQWWEYDFRYRADFKIEILDNQEKVPARFTDLRRGAGCVVAFKEWDVGQDIKIISKFLGEDMQLGATIMSKRHYLLGRGVTYGVKFLNEDPEQKRKFQLFSRYWRHNSKVKLRNKFKGS